MSDKKSSTKKTDSVRSLKADSKKSEKKRSGSQSSDSSTKDRKGKGPADAPAAAAPSSSSSSIPVAAASSSSSSSSSIRSRLDGVRLLSDAFATVSMAEERDRAASAQSVEHAVAVHASTALVQFVHTHLVSALSTLSIQLSRDMSTALLGIGWPRDVDLKRNAKQVQALTDEIESGLVFQQILASLSDVSMVADICRTRYVPEAWLLDLMLRPVVKSFLFHFMGDRKTNDITKPSWFLTYLLDVLSRIDEFLRVVVQPLFDRHQIHQDVKSLVSQGLVRLGHRKLLKDYPRIFQDELFCKLANELISFDRSMRLIHVYPRLPLEIGLPDEGPLTMLDFCTRNESVLLRWIAIEKSSTTNKLREALTSEECWVPAKQSRRSVAPIDRLKGADSLLELESETPPEIIVDVLNILDGVTDRYRFVRGKAVKLRFVEEIQLPMLDFLHSEMSEALSHFFS
mmetsp:Transcript_38034/g.95616  ORF Transcript_38034/g.95616 Transcript_38034/m.95616 type:complete len:457 (-) Transcript_38034:1621-2991(-)